MVEVTNIMKRATLCLFFFICGCSDSPRVNVDLSSPAATVETRYRALEQKDLDTFIKVHADPAWIKREEFFRLANSIVSSKIEKTLPMETSDSSASGEVYVLVEEKFRGVDKPGNMHYVLRKTSNGWLIARFNAGEELPMDPKIIEQKVSGAK
jgi:hypothetical protein